MAELSVLDSRQLLFDEAAIRASVTVENRVARHLQLPMGAADRVHLMPDEQCLEIVANGPGGNPTIHRLSAAQLGALLIAYCIGSGIPVPRNCKKTIVVNDHDVALMFTSRIASRG